ncbi:MAG: hypothetical protein SH817_08655 [Leptospira sp.]|nr:hypothetical protein [Leptospira sp.]
MLIGKIEAKIIAPDNPQRTDQAWEWEAIPTPEQKKKLNGEPFLIKLGPNSQCVGNTHQDLLYGVAKEFPAKIGLLATEDTYEYYTWINSYLYHLGKPYDASHLKYFQVHVDYFNHVFKIHGIPVKAKGIEIPKKEQTLETVKFWIEETKRQVGLGTFLTGSGGHWMRGDTIEVHDDHMGLGGNDPFGTSPYKSKTQKTRVRVVYKDKFLESKTIRRITVLEDHKW